MSSNEDIRADWVNANYTRELVRKSKEKLKAAVDVVLRAGDVSTDPKVARATAEVRGLEAAIRLLEKGEP